MKCAVEMSSGAIIYIPLLIKIGSAFQNLMGEGGEEINRHTDNMKIAQAYYHFFKIRKAGYKRNRLDFSQINSVKT
jgi:hypothetical protein